MSKACSECSEVKPLEEFHRQAATSDGRKSACKACGCKRARAFYRNHREHFLAYAKSYMKDRRNRARSNALKNARHVRDPRHRMLMHAKIRAKRFGLSFDLTIGDISVPGSCPVLGMRLTAGGGKRQHDASPSIDRIVPRDGYVRGNVAVISWRANRIKSDATADELRAVLAYLETKPRED